MLSYPDFVEKQIIFIDSWELKNLSIKNSNLLVTEDDETVSQISLAKIFAVFISGNATFTSTLIQKLIKNGAIIILMNRNLSPYCLIGGETEGNFLLREKQYLAKENENFSLAQSLVRNKIENQIELLKKRREKDADFVESIVAIEKLNKKIEKTTELKELLGLEGNVSRIFFKSYFKKFDWRGRKPRTKYDENNVLLDIGYTFLFNFIEANLRLYGFDIYKGFYHTQFYQRKSLVCDLMEPFRSIIDYELYRSLALKKFDKADFEFKNGVYKIKRGLGQKYTSIFLKAIMRHKSEIFLYLQQYYRNTMKGQFELPVFKIK